MRNITGMIGRYLSGVSLPSMNIIDIIEVMLIAFLYISLWYGSSSPVRILCSRVFWLLALFLYLHIFLK